MKSLVLLLALVGVVAGAQEKQKYETVIEETRFNSASKVILDQEAIRKSKAPNIPTLLATQANISVVNSSFQPSSIFLRGGDSGHILILVDGLPFYDASTTQKTFNLNELDITTVRKIEIIKGSQSVLYGGQALTGVIKIETFPAEVSNQTAGSLEAGQREYRKASAYGMKALSEENGMLARVVMSEKNNRSPLKESDFKYRSRLLTGDVGYLHQSDFNFYFKASRIEDYNEAAGTDPTTGTLVDTKDFEIRNQYYAVQSGLRLPKIPLKPVFLVGYQEGERKFEQPVMASFPGSGSNLKYESHLLNARADAFLLDQEEQQLRTGVQFTNEKLVEVESGQDTADQFQEYSGIFLKYDRSLVEAFEFELGARSDYTPQKQRIDTYQLGLTLFKNWKLEYATGFRTPSLFQLYSANYGNKDLQAERSQTYSLTYERSYNELNSVSATIFDTYFNNLILFQGLGPSTGQYRNISKTQTRGIETQYTHRTEDRIRADLNLGYQEPRDIVNARWLPRRPLKTAGFRLTKEWDRDSAGLEVVANSGRLDTASGTKNLEGFVIAHAFYNHQISEQFKAYVRGNNVTDRRYEQTGSFFDEGAFWLVGLEISQ